MAKSKKPGGNIAGTPHNYMLVDIDKLTPYEKNAKLHPLWHVKQIKESITQFGFMNPIIANDQLHIVAGHGRYEAAKMLGLTQVPVILVSHLSEEKVRAYRLADNKLNQNTGNDLGLLRVEVQELDKLALDFSLETIGFTTGELDLIIRGDEPPEEDDDDKIPLIRETPITRSGDIWLLGKHRLLCGTSLEPSNYKALLNGETTHAVFSDPPYNVPVQGHICGKGKTQHDEFAMASGEMSDEEFEKFLAAFIALVIEHTANGSLHYICMDWRGIKHLLNAAHGQYRELKNICVWNKDNGGLGSLYRSKHELVAVFKNGTAPHTNNILLGKHGRYRTNVWDYRGVNGFGGQDDLKLHPTVKPVALVANAIMDCTRRGELVLDPFAGSGSTLIACEKSGRQARCIELEPKYCDVIIRRWQELTGEDAVHAETGKTFNETAEQGGSDHE